MAEWVQFARKFAATGIEPFLWDSANRCEDLQLKEFLLRRDVAGQGFVPAKEFRPVAQRLEKEGRIDEAAIVEILSGRLISLMSEELDRAEGEGAARICEHLVNLSSQNQFEECEARFSAALGVFLMKHVDPKVGIEHLTHACAIYERILGNDEGIYRIGAAVAKNNLGMAYKEVGDLGKALSSFRDAANLFRELYALDRVRPAVYFHGALHNLGEILCSQENYADATIVYTEAVEIAQGLMNRDAKLHANSFYGTSYLLAVVLRGDGKHSEALRRLDEMETPLRLERARLSRYQLALVLSVRGQVLFSENDFAGSLPAFFESRDIHRELSAVDADEFVDARCTTLQRLGKCLCARGNLVEGANELQEAVELLRKSKESVSLATALTELAAARRDLRVFREAMEAINEAVKIYENDRATASSITSERTVEYAIALDVQGTILRAIGEFANACDSLKKAVTTFKQLSSTNPERWNGDLAVSLMNLGNALSQSERVHEAAVHFEEALQLNQDLAKFSPPRYLPAVARNLLNLSNAWLHARKPQKASEANAAAVELYKQLSSTNPNVYRKELVAAYGNQVAVYVMVGDGDASLRSARRAVDVAEAHADDSTLFRIKGNARNAYRVLCAESVRHAKHAETFDYLAALREGPVRAQRGERGRQWEHAVRSLRKVEESLGRSIQIVVVEEVPRGDTLMGVFRSDREASFELIPSDDFGHRADALSSLVAAVFDAQHPPSVKDVREAGHEAWKALPESIREALDPNSSHSVLISGDTQWNHFPWEGLSISEREGCCLGLYRTLARWGPLTAASLQRLRPIPLGSGKLYAAILCPWDAVPGEFIPGAKREAEEIALQLAALGYALLPNGSALIGKQATNLMMERVLQCEASVIHYTGHGAVIDEDEVLVFASSGNDPGLFGRTELRKLAEGIGRSDRLLSSGPLVTLNSCYSGRVKSFGGQREDLISALLTEGAEAVIGSAFPVFDEQGELFGTRIYSANVGVGAAMGDQFKAVRATVEAEYRKANSPIWAAWMLLHYHGNPYTRLPHSGDT